MRNLLRPNKKSHEVQPIGQPDIQTTDRMKDHLFMLQLFEHDLENMRGIKDVMSERIGEIAKRHYDMIERIPHLQNLIEQHSSRERLTQTFVRYFQSLSEIGQMDRSFLNSRLRVGKVHSRIQLSSAWYLGSYVRLYEVLIPALVQKYANKPRRLSELLISFLKVVTMDMQLIMEAYEEENHYDMIDRISGVLELILQIDALKEVLQSVHNTSAHCRKYQFECPAIVRLSQRSSPLRASGSRLFRSSRAAC